MKAHVPTTLPNARKSSRAISWLVCRRCGLVYLKNAATEKAIRAGCSAEDDK